MIGILVIGESPRPDLEAELRRIIPADTGIRLVGVLDGMSTEERKAVSAKPGDETLFAVLPDGSDIRLGHEAISRLAPVKLKALSEEGCRIVLFCCTGEFPELEDQPFLLPAPILTKTVCGVVRSGHLGVFVPLPEQAGMVQERWQSAGIGKLSTVPLAPNAPGADILSAAQKMARIAPDYVVYDCMSYGTDLRQAADAVIGRPSIMAVSLIARILAELSNGHRQHYGV